MAATFLSHISLLQPNPSLSHTPYQSPRLHHVLRNQQPPLNLSFVAKRANGVVPKASRGVMESNSKPPISAKMSNNPIVVIDNYDSFTYNLCQYMGELGYHFEVYRNDELTVEELKRKNPRGVLISPGPGEPQDSGISLQTVLELGPIVPVFGVCMGLQCIGEAFGGKIVRSPLGVMHGKSSLVYYDEKGEDGLLSGLSNPFLAGRYHSLVIEKESFPDEELEVTAWTEDGLIMAARHKKYRHLQGSTRDVLLGDPLAESTSESGVEVPVEGTPMLKSIKGVQFHPESIITPEGKTIVRNFVKLIEKKEAGGS